MSNGSVVICGLVSQLIMCRIVSNDFWNIVYKYLGEYCRIKEKIYSRETTSQVDILACTFALLFILFLIVARAQAIILFMLKIPI